MIHAHFLAFPLMSQHHTLSPPLWGILFCCEHSQRPSLPPPPCSFAISFLLFYLWNSLIWMQNCSFLSLGLAAGSLLDQGPFAFSSSDKEKKRNLPSSLTELCREPAGLLASPGTSSNGQREGGKEQGRSRSDRQSWDQGPGGGQHSHSLHADDSLEGISAGENLTSCYAQTQAALCDYAARNTAAFTSRTVNSTHIGFGVWHEQKLKCGGLCRVCIVIFTQPYFEIMSWRIVSDQHLCGVGSRARLPECTRATESETQVWFLCMFLQCLLYYCAA